MKLKRIAATLARSPQLLLLLLLAVLPLRAAAARVTIDGIDYYLSGKKAVCEGPNDRSTFWAHNLSLPETITDNSSTYTLTSIKENAFIGCKELTGTLTIPNSVTDIGNYAFSACSKLTGELIIPNSVTLIGVGAFYACSGFTGSLVIPNSVLEIGDGAFQDCTGFNGSLTMGNSLANIGDDAFNNCYGFKDSLQIGSYVYKIGNRAFKNCSGFTGSLTIPRYVRTLGSYAFQNCSGFNGSLTIGNSLNEISKNTFDGCIGFSESLTIGYSVQVIREEAFKNCAGFKRIFSEAFDPPTFSLPPFPSSLYDDATLIVSNINSYKEAYVWKNFTNIKSSPSYISITERNLVLQKGENYSLNYRVSPADAYGATPTWKSSSTNVATVTAEGVVSGVEIGMSTVSATLYNGKSASTTVYVAQIEMPSVEILSIGESLDLSAWIEPKDLLSGPIAWLSSDSNVAIVDASGIITGKGAGKTTITLSFDNKVLAECEVYVYSLSIAADASSMKPEEILQLDAEYLPEDLPDRTLTWSSSDDAVATVDENGLVTAVAPGNVTITATTAYGQSATFDILVWTFTFSKPMYEISVGESETIVPVISPQNLAEQPIAWSSSDESVATVDADGKVMAISGGKTTITATINDNISAECEVLVPEASDGGVAFRYDAGLDGAVVYNIPDQECYVVPQTVSLPDGRSYAVKGVMLDEQPASLRKVAYPQGAGTNFSASVVAVPYDAGCTVADGLITDHAAGRLVFVDMAASGAFEIPATIASVGPDAFALCSGITALLIADSDEVLAFEGTTGDGPAFAASPLTSLYMGRNVTAAGESPFRSNATLAELTLGSGVTVVANNMFRDCTALRELSLPATLTEAGSASFGFCTGLSQVFLEDSRNAIDLTGAFLGSTMDYLYMGRPVVGNAQWPRTLKAIETGRDVDTLGPSAFIDLPNLYSLTIGVGMRTLDVDAFKGSKITKVIWLPNTPPTGYDKIVADINYVSTTNYELDNMTVSANLSAKFIVDGLVYVFNKRAADRTCAVIDSHYNRYLTALDVPHKLTYQGIEFTVEEINDYALYANSYFRTASIGDGIVSIGRYALFCCSGIDSAPYIGKAVQTIGDHAFFGCSGIPSVIIPDATEFLGPWSLASCTALESAILGTGLQVIEQGCFSDDSSLLQIVVPANVQTIANQVFDRCTSLAYLEISDRTTTLTMGYSEHNDAYKPSDGTIGGLATAGVPLFYYCPLKEAYIGGDISYLTSPADGYSPFYRNDYLEKVIIHNNETEISDNEFYGCRNLHEVVVGNDVARVGNYAFSGCLNLEYFTLGSHVETIGIDAFSDCDKMKELRSYNPVPPVCGDQAMDDINVFSCTLYVPHSAVEAYRGAPQWENFFHIEGMDTGTIPVETITLDPEEWSGPLGSEFRITATVAPYNADNMTLSWSSSDTSVASVDSEGRVTVNGIGSCVITARANDGSGVSATCAVTGLPVVAEEIVLSQTEAEIELFKTLQLTATVLPEYVTDPTVEWSSSDEYVATVDEDGLVKAVGVGTATITATCGEASATCDVTVIDKLSALLELSRDGDGPLTVYTLGGVRLDIATADELRKLEPGFYIINGKKILLR